MSKYEKSWRPSRSPDGMTTLTERVDELQSTLRLLDPEQIAVKSGIPYLMMGPGRGEFHAPFWGNVCILTWPGLTGYDNRAETLTDFQLAFLLYHLLTADGTPLSGRWVSFADLPDGRTYNAAFRGYSGDEVVKTFGLNLDEYRDACLSIGGQGTDFASASFIFQPLPHVPLMISYWLGDEEFPSSCRILFDATATHYLPIDACAILGSMLVRKLIRAYHSASE